MSANHRFAIDQEGWRPLIALFHDIGRMGDEDDSIHGQEGKALVERHFGRELSYLLAPQDLLAVKQGVANHTGGVRSSVKEIGAAWDADRLRLAWEFGLQAKYFSTATGLKFASSAENLILPTWR
jgi:hypothetical protein